jgi:hypothetical protein
MCGFGLLEPTINGQQTRESLETRDYADAATYAWLWRGVVWRGSWAAAERLGLQGLLQGLQSGQGASEGQRGGSALRPAR